MNTGTRSAGFGLMLVCAACASIDRRDRGLPEPDLAKRADVAFHFLQDPGRVVPQLAENQDFMAPVPRETPLPEFPAGAHIEANTPVIVVVRIVVGEDGAVREVLEGPLAGPNSLDIEGSFRMAVEDAVRRWTFDPAAIRTLAPGEDLDGDSKPDYKVLVASTPVPAYLDVRFRFEIVEGRGHVRLETARDLSP